MKIINPVKNRMFLILLFVLTISFHEKINAQENYDPWKANAEAYFNQPHIQFTDGLTLFALRADLSLNINQTRIKFDLPVETKSYDNGNFLLESFLPLVKSNAFSSNLGIRYNKVGILAEDSRFSKTMQYFYTIGLASYVYKNWKFMLSTEYYMNGDLNSFSSVEGNEFMPLLTVGYQFNSAWKLFVMTGLNRSYMYNDYKDMPIPGVMASYKPSENFQMIVGLPVTGFDWRVSNKIDISSKLFLSSSLLTEAYISYNFDESTYFSLHYETNDNRSNNGYFQPENYQNVTFTKLSQLQYNYSGHIGFKASDKIGIILTASYIKGGKIGLYYNQDHQMDVEGKDKFYIGAAVQLLEFFE